MFAPAPIRRQSKDRKTLIDLLPKLNVGLQPSLRFG
jgi:hypothetical protein